jgi:hypothetical protein
LLSISRHRPELLAQYLATCAQNEHFIEYREIVKQQIQAQLLDYFQLEKVAQQHRPLQQTISA